MECLRIRQAIPLLWRRILSSNTTEIVEDPGTKPRLYIITIDEELDIIQST